MLVVFTILVNSIPRSVFVVFRDLMGALNAPPTFSPHRSRKTARQEHQILVTCSNSLGFIVTNCKEISSVQKFVRYFSFIGAIIFHFWTMSLSLTLFYKFCPNLLNVGIHRDRAHAKQNLLRWPRPLPSDRAIPVLWKN